jgi:alkylated DNA nucleotide flippase Atl1
MEESYTELVLCAVEQIPPGRVATYGDIAKIVGRGGPRQVGHVLARFGGGVPWWRVVRADGRPARSLEERGLLLLRADKTPIKGDRVDLARARFTIDEAAG